MDVLTYLDRARAVAGLESDYALARALGVTKQHVSDIRRGIALPGDELMLRVAELAGEDQELAVMRLLYWKARHGAAKATYRRIIERLSGATVALALGFSALGAPAPSARAFSDKSPSVYYGTRRGRRQSRHGGHALTTLATA